MASLARSLFLNSFPDPMQRVFMTGRLDHLDEVVQLLHELNLLHLVDSQTLEEDDFDIGKPLEGAEDLAGLTSTLQAVIRRLDLDADVTIDQPYRIPTARDQLVADLERVTREVTSVLGEKEKIADRLSELAGDRETYRQFSHLDIPLDLLVGYRNLRVFTGTVSRSIKTDLGQWLEAEDLPAHAMLEEIALRSGTNHLVVVAVPKDSAVAIRSRLNEASFNPIDIPEGAQGRASDMLETISQEEEKLREQLEDFREQLTRLRDKHLPFIVGVGEHLEIEFEKLNSPLRFATSERSFIVEGWVPSESWDVLDEGLPDHVYRISEDFDLHHYGHKAHEAHEGHIEPEEVPELPPTKLPNPKILQPFEVLVGMSGTPKYTDVNPTRFFAITFPILFGYMVGDWGYGILFAAMFGYIGFKKEADFFKILFYCGLWSIFFGVFFDEFFGFHFIEPVDYHGAEGTILGEYGFFAWMVPILEGIWGAGSWIVEGITAGLATLFNTEQGDGLTGFHGHHIFPIIRAESVVVSSSIMMAILIGLFHVLIGFVHGGIVIYRTHGFWLAWKEKWSWIVAISGGTIALMGMGPELMGIPSAVPGGADAGDLWAIIGGVMLVIGVVSPMMTKMGGVSLPINVIEFTHIFSFMGNILSYSRLAAIGLSSALIAELFNDFAFELAHAGGLMILVGIIVFIFGHVLNLGLAFVGGFMHSFRLHLVEYFQKFFEGGGTTFDPFGSTRKYSEVVQ